MILPSNNISILDVRQVLNEPSTDLGTLCTSNNINIFSKWKPIDYNGTTIDEGVLVNYTGGDGYKAPYGIRVLGCTEQNGDTFNTLDKGQPEELYTEYPGLIGAIIKNGSTTTYYAPKGGSSSPYRLGDFRNYNQIGGCPIRSMGSVGTTELNNGGSTVTKLTNPQILTSDDDTVIQIEDIYSNYYKEDGVTVNLTRGIYMIYRKDENSTPSTAWCTKEIDWSKKSAWQTDMYVTCFDFLCDLNGKTFSPTDLLPGDITDPDKIVDDSTEVSENKGISQNYIYSTSDRFYAIPSTEDHPNPYVLHLTGMSVAPYALSIHNGKLLELTLENGDKKTNIGFSILIRAYEDNYTGGKITNLKATIYIYKKDTEITAFTIPVNTITKDYSETLKNLGDLPIEVKTGDIDKYCNMQFELADYYSSDYQFWVQATSICEKTDGSDVAVNSNKIKLIPRKTVDPYSPTKEGSTYVPAPSVGDIDSDKS